MRRSLTVFAVAVVVAAGLIGEWVAASAQQGKGGTATLEVYSRLTVVDVTATDADGKAMHGLQRSDFTILEDGKPQSIRNFEEVSSQYVEPPRELPPHVYTNLEPPAPTPAVNVLLLDFVNEAPVDDTNLKQVSQATYLQHEVKQQAMQAIDAMTPGHEWRCFR